MALSVSALLLYSQAYPDLGWYGERARGGGGGGMKFAYP